jgi:hypothetical protein
VTNAHGTSTIQKTDYITVTPPQPFLPGWANRKLHTLSGSTSGVLTDYQVRFKIYNTTGTDSGENVYLGSHVKSDFSDLRFTTTDNTVLTYWVQETGSNNAIVWVKVPTIPTTGTQMYLYYGNPSASTLSDGAATFLFFDTFPGPALDSGRWPTHRGETISSGTCILNVASDTPGTQDLIHATSFEVPLNSATGFRFKPEPGKTARAGISDAESFSASGVNLVGIQFYTDGYIYTDTSNDGSLIQMKESPYTSAFQTICIDWTPGSARVYRDDMLLREYSSHVPTGSDSLHVLFRDVQTVDWVFVRKSVSSPPLPSTWSGQEVNPDLPAASQEVSPL